MFGGDCIRCEMGTQAARSVLHTDEDDLTIGLKGIASHLTVA